MKEDEKELAKKHQNIKLKYIINLKKYEKTI